MRRNGKGPSQRQLKVGEELRHVLSETFAREDFYDKETKEEIKVTVSEVKISQDLRNATVYVVPFGGRNREKTMASLQNIAPAIRAMVTGKINLRYSPLLTFRIDDSFEAASEILTLLNSPKVKKDLS